MASLASLQADRQPLTVLWRGHAINLEYKPAAVTMEYDARMEQVKRLANEGDEDALGVFRQNLVDVLASWDLKEHDEDPEPAPITADVLARIPRDIVLGIFNAVEQDAESGKAPPSSVGSSQVVPLDRARTGTS